MCDRKEILQYLEIYCTDLPDPCCILKWLSWWLIPSPCDPQHPPGSPAISLLVLASPKSNIPFFLYNHSLPQHQLFTDLQHSIPPAFSPILTCPGALVVVLLALHSCNLHCLYLVIELPIWDNPGLILLTLLVALSPQSLVSVAALVVSGKVFLVVFSPTLCPGPHLDWFWEISTFSRIIALFGTFWTSPSKFS